MDSIGSLIDELTVVNIKIYHLVDIILAEGDDYEVASAAKKAQALNQDRTNIINVINERLGQTGMIVKV